MLIVAIGQLLYFQEAPLALEMSKRPHLVAKTPVVPSFSAMPKYLVVSSSGNPSSNSRRMGRIAFHYLQKAKMDCSWIDLAEMDLPLCDADACYAHPSARKLSWRSKRQMA